MNNEKQIALAMHNYHAANDHLPPAAIKDKAGKPLLSWRVAILPYLEQAALYNKFHLDEPWDSPHNKALIASMPAVYACPEPADRGRGAGDDRLPRLHRQGRPPSRPTTRSSSARSPTGPRTR